MACGLILIPLSIGIISSVNDHNKWAYIQSLKECVTMKTRFNDTSILVKTLNEYGLCPKQISPNRFSVHFSDGDIIYDRPSANSPFVMTVQNIKDKARLIKELDDIEQVYNGNVQEYTYQRVLTNLPEGMAIEHEEVLDDNSIVITVNVG